MSAKILWQFAHFVFWKTKGSAIRLVLWVSYLSPSLPSLPTPIMPFAECEVASPWGCAKCTGCSFPRVTASLLVTSDCLQGEHAGKGKISFSERQRRNAQMSQSRLVAGGTLNSHSMGKGARWCNTPALLSLTPPTLLLQDGRDLSDWLVWRGNWASQLSPFLFFSSFHLLAGSTSSLLLHAAGFPGAAPWGSLG